MALATITARGLSRRTMLAAPLLVGRGARGFRIGGGLASLSLPRVGRAPAEYAPAGAARDALATTSPDYFAYDWNLNTQ